MTKLVWTISSLLTLTLTYAIAFTVYKDTFVYSDARSAKHPAALRCSLRCLQDTDSCIGFEIIEDECYLMYHCNSVDTETTVRAVRAYRGLDRMMVRLLHQYMLQNSAMENCEAFPNNLIIK